MRASARSSALVAARPSPDALASWLRLSQLYGLPGLSVSRSEQEDLGQVVARSPDRRLEQCAQHGVALRVAAAELVQVVADRHQMVDRLVVATRAEREQRAADR